MIRSAAVIALLSACSFNMQRLDPKWDGTYEPACNDIAIVTDRILGVAFLLAGVEVLSAKQDSSTALVGGVAIGAGIIYEISALVGSGIVTECRAARTKWAYSNAIKARDPGGAAKPGSAGAAVQPASAAPVSRPAGGAATSIQLTPSSPHDERRPWAAGVSDREQKIALGLYVAGNHEFIQARYAQALARYQEAIQHWDHPAIRFNMAVCLINLDQPVEARDNLERSLVYGAFALGPDAYGQGLTYRKLLDAQLVRLTLDCPEPDEEVVLDGKLVFKGPGVVDRFVLPGEHQVFATKPGFLPASRKIVLVAGKPVTYEIRPLVDPRPGS